MSSVALFEARSYLDDWRETHEVALLACRRAGNRRGEAAMRYSLGALALSEGRFNQAAVRLQQALSIFDELSDSHGMGLTERNLALIDRVYGDFDQALTRYDRALTALRAAGDAIGQAHVLCNIAVIKMDSELYDVAEGLLTQAVEITRRVRCRRVEAQARNQLGQCMLARGNLQEAAQAFQWVVSAAQSMGDLVGEAYALYGLGNVMLRLGEYSQAGLLVGQAQRLAADVKEPFLLAQVLLARGRICQATGRFSDGARHLSEAEERFNQLNAKPWSARAQQVLKECLAKSESPDQPLT
jgi:tetratricopeptide (TPR) repeat protein